MSGTLLRNGLADLAAALRAGKVSARELLEDVLQRIDRFNPALNAVVTLDAEQARRRADAIDAARARGEVLPPLAGIPITIKDSIETAGLRTTCGSAQWATHVPVRNAEAVQRLFDAGCVIVGKTNTPAYAGDLQTHNEMFGTTSNPWNLQHTSGGSSGGSAVTVACSMSAFELGSDIGGSIRTPAHFCGVYGHKPTYGLVPTRGHIPPPPASASAPDLAVVGPLARSADDLATTLCILGNMQADSQPLRAKEPARMRVAVWLEDPDLPLDHPVRATLENAVDLLGRAGVRLNRAPPAIRLCEVLDDYLQLLWPVTTAHLSFRALQRLVDTAGGHPPESWHAKLARYVTASHRDWLAAHERRERLRAFLEDYFRDCDVLLMPVNPVTAIPHDHSADLMARTISVNGTSRWYWEQLGWIALATACYLPATVAPVGRCSAGLPVGIQIVGRYGADLDTLAFAAWMSDIVGGFQPPPGYQ